MKLLHYISLLQLLVLCCSQCSAPFQQIPYGAQFYCVKCDTTCLTCSGGTPNTCSTCPTDFTLVISTSSCTPPSTTLINTIDTLYHIFGFVTQPNWYGGVPSSCGIITALTAAAAGTISRTYTFTASYKLRILVSVWWFSGPAPIYLDLDTTPLALQLPIAVAAVQSNSTTTYQAYCTNSRSTNIDYSFLDSTDTTLTISFTSASTSWGIRQFVFIQFNCLLTTCATCNGPLASNCLSCTDPYKAVFSGSCLCDYTQHYYQYPDASNLCVNPCPTLLTGQYYGDYSTKQCVLTCPIVGSTTLYSSDVTNECVATCPSTLLSVPLYYDVTNRKCVTKCPTTQPYSWWSDSKCYSTCPNNYYRLDTNLSCVSACPTNGQIPLLIDTLTGSCVDKCTAVGYWADILTGYCALTCTGGYFKDNSTYKATCVQNCPSPLYFGDSISVPASPACVLTCPTNYFGNQDPASPRICIAKCTAGLFGLLTGNRACVPTCPSGTWGQTAGYTCINVPNRCAYGGYADNLTRLCVGGTNLPLQVCSSGQYKLNTSRTCQLSCPPTTYASTVTFFCQSACVSPYFADPGINACVTTCATATLFADVSSSRTCVAVCNQLGATPFMDDSTRTCVNICPNSPYYYADIITYWCTFNCTTGLYADDSVANKTCVTNCPSPAFAFNTTNYGVCILVCPDNPPSFGDVVAGLRICVEVCQNNYFGDQTGNRYCVTACPTGWYAQADALRRCVKVCNTTTYGWNKVCGKETDCPTNYTGDPSTQTCVNLCPAAEGTFADNISKLCVSSCPVSNGVIYYADITDRWCRAKCTATLLFGNNSTRTCQEKCLDDNAYADAQSTNRICISYCTPNGAILYYRNNYTMVCVLSTGCPQDYFADNTSQSCVERCPVVGGLQSWGYIPTQTCVAQCVGTWGEATKGIAYCVSLCSVLPPRWSYNGNMTCMAVCPTSPSLFGEDFTRTCTANCPRPPAVAQQTFAYDGTRRCLYDCPTTTYADYITGVCFHTPIQCLLCAYSSSSCTYRWADAYNNSCVSRCAGPTPDNSFGDNSTYSCTLKCSANSYADNYTGTRICVARCPGEYDNSGVPNGPYDSFGDDSVNQCVLRCVTPSTWADWQSSKCEARCTGDAAGTVSTYSENTRQRCTVALACPFLPDKLYGEALSRTCSKSCIFYANGSISYADNITRKCILQCYQFVNGSVTTRFYGDVSTGLPICVIACPAVPRLFGRNDTNLCVPQCPTLQYGDQTGNRSCVPICPIIGATMWFSQIHEQLCVTICENGTWGNTYNQHCEVVATDCITSQFGDNSTSLCVSLCPESQNYFGDPSTKQCTDRCPNLLSPVVNATAGINLPAARLFADYSNRLCVLKCAEYFGYSGTFGDNLTNTCVEQCPQGSYGDPNTLNRYCVATCTGSAFADPSSTRCVSVCPSSPPTFGYTTNSTCLKSCPPDLWANPNSRRCVSACTPLFRLLTGQAICVSKCPSNPDLYADPSSHNCTSTCTNSLFADPTDRTCKASCSPLFQYNFRCVLLCPHGYYANALNNCVQPAQCDANTYGQNLTTTCTGTCPAGSYADSASRYCIAVCPDTTYGDAEVCVGTCQTPATSASTITQLCESVCFNYTYALLGTCVAVCTTGYRNDLTHTCASGCNTATTSLYADPTTHDCVAQCPYNYFRSPTGFCVGANNGCGTLFADNVTQDCVSMCSEGFWGYTANHTCLDTCPSGYYGYTSMTERTCYQPTHLPSGAPLLFADPLSLTFVPTCSETPVLYFGDRVSELCVTLCPPHASTNYYGDPNSRQCESACTAPLTYTADPLTSLCTLKCTLNTFRYATSDPICVNPCPAGYADPSTRVCVTVCPLLAQTFGYYNASSGDRVCIANCPSPLYADPTPRTCVAQCVSATFADNSTRQCKPFCTNSFADLSNKVCVSQCLSVTYPFADPSTNACVGQCPPAPDLYGDQHKCVSLCLTPSSYAYSDNRLCVPRCLNLSGITYGDPRTGRCESACSEGYWADNSTNLCVGTCPASSFADNTTGTCVGSCPAAENLYADTLLHTCSYTCSNNYFGSQLTQTCIPTCQSPYWGDPTTTLCVSMCNVKYYSFGDNITRKCTNTTCSSGFADNQTRVCVAVCQNYSTPRTFADPTTKSCVAVCPLGSYAYNVTVICTTHCPDGFADNYSRYCVAKCPSQPQSYGDTHLNVCLYQCLNGEFSDNSTNLCVVQCPAPQNYFGDPHNGRCVLFCTEGTYADTISRECVGTCPSNSWADNLTRSCVADCPPTQATFAEVPSQKCVRVCRSGLWADNLTQTCVSVCPKWANGTQTYADDYTKFCVLQCPIGYFGRNDTHTCETLCTASTNLYGHPWGRVCVAVTNCFPVSTNIYYADSVSRTCVLKCPLTLWADTTVFRCRNPCAGGQYRNTHTQTCDSVCPTTPDQYADTVAGTCVRTCPNGTYAHTATRTCISACGTYGLLSDNSTNRCVSACNTDPYLYADYNLNKCVYTCDSQPNYYADNSTQSCVPTCSAAWQYFADPTSLLCLTLCPPNTYADTLSNRMCLSTCTNGYFADAFTSTCVLHCSLVRPYYFEDINSKSCVTQCPGQSYAYNPDQTCKYPNPDGSSSCPNNYYADRISRQCVLFCPYTTYSNLATKYCQSTCTGSLYADPILRKCVGTCSNNTYAHSSHTCVQYCPAPTYAQNSTQECVGVCLQLGLNTTRTCQAQCPLPYFADNINHVCVTQCNPLFADPWLRQCVDPCTAPAFSNPLTFTCDLHCPANHYANNVSRQCTTTCTGAAFADPTVRICMAVCSDYPLLFAENNLCVEVCSTFGYEADRTCRPTCPNVSNEVYLADTSNHRCVLECTNQVLSFADYHNNVCTALCPIGKYASNYTKECVSVCPTVPNATFANNDTRTCVAVCPPNTFGDTTIGYCAVFCTLPYFADPTTHLCVLICPINYFAHNLSATCRTNCLNSYADPQTRRCVAQCPALHDLFNYANNNTCLPQCPTGFYANTDSYTCVSLCNSSIGLYAYAPANTCVRECPVPYKGYALNHTCILNCPPLFFYNIKINTCDSCLTICLVCIDLSTCIQCIPGYNLFNGVCNQSCTPTPLSTTYASPSGQCVFPCPSGYYGDNTTYTCTQTCPNKQYGSVINNLCLNCPSVCAQCTSPTNCGVCEGSATLAIDNMCYAKCNDTHPYSYQSLCYLTCPFSTYLTYTNVVCVTCGSTCLTCTGSPTTCLSCSASFLHNSSCLATCPTNFYGSPALLCLNCTLFPSAACTTPLNFTTAYSVQNYQYVVTMKFNQGVNITQQISKIIKVQLKLNRRLLQISTIINDGVPYTYEILPDGSVKLYLQVTQNLVQPTFSIQVTDPTAITSLTSNISLQNVNSDLYLPQLQFYTAEASTQAPTNTAAIFVITFLLALYALSFVWSDTLMRPLQLLQLLALHCVIDTSVPANTFYFLLHLLPSLLQFLPNFTHSPTTPLYTDLPQKITDLFIDADFLRNVGHIFFFITLFAIPFFLFKILSNKKVVQHKVWHSLFQTIAVKRYGIQVVNDVIGILYIPILYFSMQSVLHFTSSTIFSSICTTLFGLSAAIYPFHLLYVWAKKDVYYFMCQRVKQQQRNTLQPILFYFYLMLQCLWLNLWPYPTPQLILLFLTNTAYLLYLLIIRPFSLLINNLMTCLLLLLLCLVECFYLFFQLTSLSASSKTTLAAPMLYVLSACLCLTVLWAVWRVVYEFSTLWAAFKTHDFYRHYGDVDVVNEEEKSEVYDLVQRNVEEEEIRVGDIVLDKICEEVGSNGVKKIKVVKKILKKKIMIRNEQQYVRVNKINPFDQIRGEKREEKKEKIKDIDQDNRDIMSDQLENYREEEEHSEEEKVNEIQFNAYNEEYYLEESQPAKEVNEKQKKVSEIDQLVEEESKKKKNLLYLFDQFESQN